VPTTTGIVRAVVSVLDLGRALRFYRDTLGLPAVSRGPGLVSLALPGGVELLLHERPPTSGLAGVALSLAVDDVDAVTAAAAEAGCTGGRSRRLDGRRRVGGRRGSGRSLFPRFRTGRRSPDGISVRYQDAWESCHGHSFAEPVDGCG
jgi:catechol 2,3-dioxygenase-like lactoylglutathione lyase family enzyme